ncbi:MAG: 3'-5' exonuclease [Alphaproteobacteria bacterium]|nr:3'-5' exonuclease [Alphaproteobacteria bacterium]
MHLPPLPWSHLPHPIAFVHLSTTGLLPRTDRVTEIAVLRMEPGKPTRWLHSRVDPGDTFCGVPGFPNLVPDLRSMLDGAIVISHNAALMAFFLDAEMRRVGGRWGAPSLCTLSLSQALRPDLTAHNLEALSRAIGRPRPEARAFSRAQATVAVLGALLDQLDEEEAGVIVRGAIEIPLRPTEWPNIVGSLVPVAPPRQPEALEEGRG